jgi:hypothetical protein
VRLRGGVDHPAVAQRAAQQVSEQERRQMVALDGGLEPVRGADIGLHHAAGIVRQDVDPGVRVQQLGRQLPDLRQLGEIGTELGRLRPRGRGADGGHGSAEAAGVAAHHDHLLTLSGQLPGGGEPDPRAGPGDDDRAWHGSLPRICGCRTHRASWHR